MHKLHNLNIHWIEKDSIIITNCALSATFGLTDLCDLFKYLNNHYNDMTSNITITYMSVPGVTSHNNTYT